VLVLGGAARRRRRDERLASLREFAAGHAWSSRPALPAVVTRHPVPRLLQPGPAAADLVLGGPWRGAPAELVSLLVRPARPGGSARRADDVLLLARLDVPPVPGGLVLVVTDGGLDASGSSAPLADAARPPVVQAVRDGVVAEGDCLVLGDASLAVAGPWRPALADVEALGAWFDLVRVVAERLSPLAGRDAP